MSRSDRALAPSASHEVVESYRPVAVPKRVGKALNRQLLQMGFNARLAKAALSSLSVIEEGMVVQLERQLAPLDELEDRRPELAERLERRRERITEQAFAAADLSRERIVERLAQEDPELLEEGFWDEDPTWWEMVKQEFARGMEDARRQRERAVADFIDGFTLGLRKR
jgi:hypothetical protein